MWMIGGRPTGEVGPKLASHHHDTKLHLAFSCYVLDATRGMFLMTRRADHKKVWPGVWTNSFCGHPAPGETMEAAIARRGAYELGLSDLHDIACVLPVYVYRAEAADGIVEHEFCPIFVAKTQQSVTANPDEVGDYRWLSWGEYGRVMLSDDPNVSFWARDQYARIREVISARQP